MKLTERIYILAELGRYMAKETPEWQNVKKEASEINPWFIFAFHRPGRGKHQQSSF